MSHNSILDSVHVSRHFYLYLTVTTYQYVFVTDEEDRQNLRNTGSLLQVCVADRTTFIAFIASQFDDQMYRTGATTGTDVVMDKCIENSGSKSDVKKSFRMHWHI
jgi:hypothetical protein